MKPATGETEYPVPWDQQSIDRLVDGEVTAAEYQAIVKQLESHPEGWRACAAAFLESQAWRRTLREMSAEADRAALPPKPARHVTDDQRRSTWTYLALAASVALAFLAGRLTPFGSGRIGPDPSAVVDRAQVDGTTDLLQSAGPTQFVNRGFLDGQSAIVPQIRQSLRNLGVQVSQQHGYIPLVTEDGTRVIVPYENVQLIPANLQPY